MNEKDALKKAKRAAKDKKIEFAGANKIDLYQDEVNEIMKAIGIDAIFISDESCIGDFSEFGATNEEKDQYIQDVSSELGFDVKYTDYIWVIAKRMHDDKETRH